MRHLVLGLVMALLLSASTAGASGSGSLSFIPDFSGGTLLRVDTVSGPSGEPIVVGSLPIGVAVLPDGSKVYVTNSNFLSSSVSVVTVADGRSKFVTVPTGIQPFRMPYGVAAAADGKQVFVTNYLGGSMSVIDQATDTVRWTVSVGILPRGVVANPKAPYVYVTNQGTDDVAFVENTATASTLKMRVPACTTATCGSDPYGVATDPDGKFLYVALQGEGKLLIMDAQSNTPATAILGSVSVGSRPAGVAVSPDGKRVYVTNIGSGTVSIIDVDSVRGTWTFNRNVSVGATPVGVSVSSDRSQVIVANSNDSSLSIINAANFSVSTVTLRDPITLINRSPIAFGNSLMPGPTFTPVLVDIKPGANPNTINAKSKGTTPVAILGSPDYDVLKIDVATVLLAGVPVKEKSNPNHDLMYSYEDVNGDGLVDLVLHFDTQRLVASFGAQQLQTNANGDKVATLRGQMKNADGNPGPFFQGTDTVELIQ